jgi:hypothetical protein
LQDGFADKDDSLAILLVDDADSGIDAAIKNGQLRAILVKNFATIISPRITPGLYLITF